MVELHTQCKHCDPTSVLQKHESSALEETNIELVFVAVIFALQKREDEASLVNTKQPNREIFGLLYQ
jgi:hypothetical protein